jgi:hypothetical protein
MHLTAPLFRLAASLLLAATTALSATGQSALHYSPPPIYDELSFYVVAHQDDWQLFMGTFAQTDIHNFHELNQVLTVVPEVRDTRATGGGKVVFIYLTSGASPNDPSGVDPRTKSPTASEPGNVPLYQIREVGAINSVKLAATQSGFTYGPLDPWPEDSNPEIVYTRGTNTIRHTVRKYVYKNTVSYFLRIPQDNFYMNATVDSFSPALPTADGAAAYSSWCDIVSTVAAIYSTEMQSTPVTQSPFINTFDSDTLSGQNKRHIPNGEVDNKNHVAVGLAALQAGKIIQDRTGINMPVTLYQGYPSQDLPANLGMPDTQNEAGLAAVYTLACIDYRVWSEWQSTIKKPGQPEELLLFQKWAARNYCRPSTINDMVVPEICASGAGHTGRPELAAGVKSALNSDVDIIYNPAGSSLSVKASASQNLVDIQFIDAAGKRILYVSGDKKADMEVDISAVAMGIYHVWITQLDAGGKETNVVRKVIIGSKL